MNSNLSPNQFSSHLLDYKTGESRETSRGVNHDLATLNAGLWRKADPQRYGATVRASK